MNYLITGANTGIGLETARALAADGRVFIACRNRQKGEAAAAAIGGEVKVLDLDLASLDSVRDCAEKFLTLDEPLDVLINNAGVGGARGLTADGFEAHFGINHLGHFLLTTLLLDRLSPNARIVNVSSEVSDRPKGIDWDALRRPTRSITGMPQYAVSKLCNVLFTQELARRYPAIHSYALHPGVVASDIWRRVPWPVRPLMTRRMISNAEGARTSVYCATSEAVADESGLFYDKCAHRPANPVATPELAAELWRRSEAWVT